MAKRKRRQKKKSAAYCKRSKNTKRKSSAPKSSTPSVSIEIEKNKSAQEQKNREYYLMPTSSEITLTGNVIAAASNIDRFISNWTSSDNYTDPSNGAYTMEIKTEKKHSLQILRKSVYPDKNGNHTFQRIAFVYDTPDIETTDKPNKMCDTDILVKHNKSVLSTFYYFLIKLNEQMPRSVNARKSFNKIEFTIKDIVASGLYNSEQKASVGWIKGALALRGLSIETWTGKEQENELSDEWRYSQTDYKNIQPFTSFGRKNGDCWIMVDSSCLSMLNSFMLIPSYVFKLSAEEENLLHRICSQARQNKQRVSKDGCFTIKMNTMRAWMNLPNVCGDPHADRTIAKIKNAVEHINSYQKSSGIPNDLFLDISPCDGLTRAKDFIRDGRLIVRVSGDYAEYLKPIAIAEEEKKRKRQERETRIADEVEVRERIYAKKRKSRKAG